MGLFDRLNAFLFNKKAKIDPCAEADLLMEDAVLSVLGEYLACHRRDARHAGLARVRVSVGLDEFRLHVVERLIGLLDDPDAFSDCDCEFHSVDDGDYSYVVPAPPTLEALRVHWIPQVTKSWSDSNVVVSEAAIDMDVVVPPPRSIHGPRGP